MRWAAFALFVALASPLVTAPSASAQTDSGSDAEARRYFEAGRAAYEAENFEEAVRNFRRAYVFSPRYPLLYNIGQAELRAGRDAQALEAFEGFLRQAPADDSRRSEVEERVRVLRAMGVTAATGTVATTTTTTATTTETDTDTTTETETAAETDTDTDADTAAATDTAAGTDTTAGGGGAGAGPWVLVGAGAVVAVVGGVLMGVGASDAGAVTGAPDGAHWSDLASRAGSANTEFGVGIALLVAGVAAAGVGIVWAVAGSGGGSSAPSSARLRLGPGSLTLEGGF